MKQVRSTANSWIEDFSGCILRGTEASLGGEEEGLRNLMIISAAYESAEKRKGIRVFHNAKLKPYPK